MIWSKDRWNTLSRSAGRWILGAGVSALAVAMIAPMTQAQQAPKSTQAPKAPAPAAAPAAAAPGAGPAGQAADDAWVKLCMKNEQTANKEICLINHEGLEPNTGMVLIAAAVRKAEGEDKQQLLIRVPTAYALVIPAGVQIRIDEQQPIQLQYSICFPTSCQVQMELTDDLYQKMRAGKQMIVAAMNIQQKTMGFPVPLSGFSKAYDGAPVDNAKYEEQRRQLMEMFRKRQAELAAKAKQGEAQAQGGAPAQAQGGAPAPAPANATAQQKQPPAAATP
ncbi:MAG: invasion associated locus B family protein [Methyloceanibacter sp.]|uniref:invasion associated locus B family protein n=1 Tax=Methyloceanibacter sp. TaxID=1965321 RepID=UPI003D6D3935